MARTAYFWSALIVLFLTAGLVIQLQVMGASQSFAMLSPAVAGFLVIKACAMLRPRESVWGRFTLAQFSTFMLGLVALQTAFKVVRASLGFDDGGDFAVRELIKASALGVLIAAPLFEEAVFRGLLWRATEFGSEPVRVAVPVVVTAIFFATMHGLASPGQATLMFAVGIILGIARAGSGGIALPLALHVGMNVFVAAGVF